MTPRPVRLWDFAGTDGLALALAVFGPEAAHLAAYQSMETKNGDTPCSLLRLCEGNFRIGVYGVATDGEDRLSDALESVAVGRRVWIKPCRLTSFFVTESALAVLTRAATVKAPHRLIGLTRDHAVPLRVGACAALVWRHAIGGVPLLEIQAAPQDREAICQMLAPVPEIIA